MNREAEIMMRALADELKARGAANGALLLSTGDQDHSTITVDLDGTLAEKIEPFDRQQVGPPRDGAHEFVTALKKIAQRVVILTAREHLEPVRRWVKENGIPVDGVTNKKEPALCHVDNLGVNAAGPLRGVLAAFNKFMRGAQHLTTLYFADVA